MLFYFFFFLSLILNIGYSSSSEAGNVPVPNVLFEFNAPGLKSVPCPKKEEGVAVLVAAGQSNLGNSVQGRYSLKGNVILFNPYDGKCYKQVEGITASFNNVAIRVAQQLIDQGPYHTVVIANLAKSGTGAREWATKECLFKGLAQILRLLSALKLSPTYFIWENGETDTNFRTPPNEVKDRLKDFFNGVRETGYKGPIYIAKSTRCFMAPGSSCMNDIVSSADKIRTVQGDLVNPTEGFFAGPDTDIIQGNGRDWFQCHYSSNGADMAAQLWVESILGQPQEKLQETISLDLVVDAVWLQIWSPIITMQAHPWIASCESEGSNIYVANRWLEFKGGGKLVENVVTYDYERRFLETRSTNIETAVLPIRRLWTRFEVIPDGEKKTLLKWTAYYDVNRESSRVLAEKKMKEFLNEGLTGLKALVENSVKIKKSA